jgi:hypothetical protein
LSSHRARSLPSLCRMSPSGLLPPDALLSSCLIVKSLHQLRCPPLFVAVADHLQPPDALLLRRHCLHCHAATPFIAAPPVLPSSSRRPGLHHRAAADCHAAAAFVFAPLLPLSSRHCFCLPRRATGSAFVNVLPLPSSSRCRSLRCCATVSAFVVAPPLPSSSRRRCLYRRAAVSAFVVGPLVLPKGCLC